MSNTSAMRMIYILLVVNLWFVSLQAQEIKIQKNTAYDFGNQKFSHPNKNMIWMLNNHTVKTQNLASFQNQLNLKKDEQVLHIDDVSSYTVHSKNDKTLIKRVNGIVTKKIDMSIDEELEAISSEGEILSSDLSHGQATGYLFYSPDLDLNSIYKPYANGFTFTNYGVSDKNVCIYSQEKNSSEKYKLSLLKSNGDLLVEKEFPRNRFLCSDVKVTRDRVYLLMNNTRAVGCVVMCYSENLNLIWKKELSKPLVNWQIQLDDAGKTLILCTQDNIQYVDGLSGKTILELSVISVLQSKSTNILGIAYVLGDKFLAFTEGTYNDHSKKISSCSLSIMDLSKGKTIYTEHLDDLSNPPKIIGSCNNFLLICNNAINEYHAQ